jgi:hypothetical protein
LNLEHLAIQFFCFGVAAFGHVYRDFDSSSSIIRGDSDRRRSP